MLHWRLFELLALQRQAVDPARQHPLDVFVGTVTVVQSTPGGILHPLRPIAFAEPDEAQATTVVFARVPGRVKQVADQLTSTGPSRVCPLFDALRRPLQVLAV